MSATSKDTLLKCNDQCIIAIEGRLKACSPIKMWSQLVQGQHNMDLTTFSPGFQLCASLAVKYVCSRVIRDGRFVISMKPQRRMERTRESSPPFSISKWCEL